MSWLRHPLREWTRTVVGEGKKSGPELDALYDQLEDTYPFVSLSNPRGSADATLSALVGTAEGAGDSVRDFVASQIEKSEPDTEAPLGRAATYATRKARGIRTEGGKFIALAGLVKPPDPVSTEALIEQVVTMAKANATRLEVGSRHAVAFPTLADFAEIGRKLLGINSGPDEIAEVRIAERDGETPDVELHAFDRAGYHVLYCSVRMDDPGVLYIAELQASHGRNADDLMMAFGGGAVPGRGNTALITAGLEALIVEGAKAGLHAITNTPGSPHVQRLYEKMGFTAPGDARPWRRRLLAWTGEKVPVMSGILNAVTLSKRVALAHRGKNAGTMRLDLTNPHAVRQALVAFQLARARFDAVPKDVAERMKEAGVAHDPPNVGAYRTEIPEDAQDTRVLRLEP